MQPVRLDAMAELFGRVVASAIGSPDEHARDAAELVVCQEVLRNLHAYMPQNVPTMPLALEAFRHMDFDDMHKALRDPDTARVFGAFRFEVTEIESANAQRLQVLCSTVQSLLRLRPRMPDPSSIDRALEQVGSWVYERWGVDAPLQGDVRLWARKQTWRMDALPKAMRHL